MRDARIRVYKFDELSEQAKEKARENWVSKGGPYYWTREARQTIEAFEKEFGVKIKDWSYSSYRYEFNLDTGSIDDDVLALKGNRARAWFWNHHGKCLMSPRTRYFTHVNGKRIEAVAADSVKYRSKIEYSRVYDGTCPWTGYYLDCCALDPISHFCFGVEWSEKDEKRIPSSRKISVDDRNTVESLLKDAADSLFSALKKDSEYQESMESFQNACEANGYEFTEDGKMWSHKEVA